MSSRYTISSTPCARICTITCFKSSKALESPNSLVDLAISYESEVPAMFFGNGGRMVCILEIQEVLVVAGAFPDPRNDEDLPSSVPEANSLQIDPRKLPLLVLLIGPGPLPTLIGRPLLPFWSDWWHNLEGLPDPLDLVTPHYL